MCAQPIYNDLNKGYLNLMNFLKRNGNMQRQMMPMAGVFEYKNFAIASCVHIFNGNKICKQNTINTSIKL